MNVCEAPNQGFLMAGFNYFTRFAVGLPFVNGNDPNLKFLLMIPSGRLLSRAYEAPRRYSGDVLWSLCEGTGDRHQQAGAGWHGQERR